MTHFTGSISVCGKSVPYTVRKRRGVRRLSLSVRSDGTVTLTVPRSVALRDAERFVSQKHAFIEQAFARLSMHAQPTPAERRAHYLAHKEEARTLIVRRLAELNTHYGFSYGRIAIRRTASRWGSCSAQGNLNFDYRVLLLPADLRDYILVHELCHVREHNHGKAFWALVAQTVPDYAARRKKLKTVAR